MISPSNPEERNMTSYHFHNRPVKWITAALAILSSAALVTAAPVKAAKPAKETKPSGGTTAVPLQAGAENLRGILIVPGKAGAKAPEELLQNVNPEGVTGIKGVVVKGPKFLQRRDFEKLLSRELGTTLTDATLRRMQTNIIKYCRKQGHLVVDVIYPQQEIVDGTIQIAVLEARIGTVSVTNVTRKWFSNSIITNDVRLKPGQAVLEQRLDGDLNWVNRNTYQDLGYFNGFFREVSASFKQGDPGITDVELQAQERFPLRGFVGVDDAGIAVIGNDQFFAGFNWANAFGLDHRLSYQYISDVEFSKFSENVMSYVIPLPWRHELTLFGVYANLNPDFSVINPALSKFSNDGYFYQISARYGIPLPELLNYSHEVTAGFDYKRTDTPLLSDPSNPNSLVSTNNINVAQFTLSYSGRLQDRWGSTAASIQGVYSPGGIGEYNTEADFDGMTRYSNPQYLYGRATIIRQTSLPYGFSWYTRAAGQLSDARLVATESYSLGGWDTVRGYDQNVVSGDSGWLLVNELRTKPFPLFGNFHGKIHGKDWIQGLVFCDYGGTYWGGGAPPPSGWPSQEILLSVGVGFRYQLLQNFMVRFDYGWQLDRNYVNAPGAATLGPQPMSRAHFGVEASF
jgi:hemolysin activation/secretion protein